MKKRKLAWLRKSEIENLPRYTQMRFGGKMTGTEPTIGAVFLLAGFGLEWLRKTMAESGKPIPNEIFTLLVTYVNNPVTDKHTDILVSYAQYFELDCWKILGKAVLILELLRQKFPLYYDDVLTVLLNHEGITK